MADSQLKKELREGFEAELSKAQLTLPNPKHKELLFDLYCNRFLLQNKLLEEDQEWLGGTLSEELSNTSFEKNPSIQTTLNEARFSIDRALFQRTIKFEDDSEIVFYQREDGSYFVAIHKLNEATAKKLNLHKWYLNYVQSAGSSFGMISDPEKVSKIIVALDDPLIRP